MSGKSCSGCFQIGTNLGSIGTFWTESETWPVAEGTFPWARGHLSKCLGTQESWKRLGLLHPALQPHLHAITLGTPSGRRISPVLKLPTPVQGCTGDPTCPWCSNFCVSARNIRTLSAVFVQQRSIWTASKFARFEMFYTLHKFVRTDDGIKHELAQGNHAARTEPLSAQTRNPFSPSSGSSEPAPKCNSSPEKWDMFSLYSHVCRVSLLPTPHLFPCPGVLPWWSLFFIAKNYILDKRKSGSSLKDILGSLECCQKAWGGTI